MTDRKISEMPVASTLDGTEVVNVVQGTSKKAPLSLIVALAKVPFVGDTGSGGQIGMVPAPTADDVANGRILSAAGTWIDPPATANTRRWIPRAYYLDLVSAPVLTTKTPRTFPSAHIP